MAKAGQITIDINAGTAKFIQDLEQVKGGIRSVGAQAGSTFNTRYAMFGLKDIAEETVPLAAAELVNELTRLKGAMLGVGLAGVGIGILAYAFLELGNKIKEANDAAAKAFRTLLDPLRTTNDELDLTNAKLENDIARLEHKPANRLAEALAEARVEADKLGEAIQGALDKLEETLKKEELGRFKALALLAIGQGQAPTTDITELGINQDKQLASLNRQRSIELHQPGVTPAGAEHINAWWDEQIERKLGYFNTRTREIVEAAQKKHLENTGPETGKLEEAAGVLTETNNDALARMKGMHRTVDLTGRKEADEDKNAADRLRREEEAKAKQAQEKQLQGWEEGFTLYKALQERTLEEDRAFWETKIKYANTNGVEWVEVTRKLNEKVWTLDQQIRTKAIEAGNKSDAEDLKAFQNHIKAIQDAAGLYPGGRPQAARLAALQESEKSDTGQSKAQLDWTDLEIVLATLAAYKETEEEQKKINEQLEKHNEIEIKAQEQTNIGVQTAKKQQAELAYARFSSHSYKEESEQLQLMAGFEKAILQDKLAAAQAAMLEAAWDGNGAKFDEAALAATKAKLEIEQQITQTKIQQAGLDAQHNATLKQGLDAFIHNANAQMKEPGDILKDGLTSALDQTSDNLTRLMTGQKTKWADEFKSIGREMVKESTKSLITMGLDKLGLNHPKPHKPLGTPNDPVYIRDVDKQQQGQNQNTDQNGLPVSPVASFPPNLGSLADWSKPASWLGKAFGGIGSGIGQLFSGGGSAAGESVSSSISFPELAGGGDVDPGSSYWVGDGGDGSGREMFTPKTAGTVTPASKMGGTTYNIDARGAELGAYNRLARGIEAAHESSVSQSARNAHEHARRTPQVHH